MLFFFLFLADFCSLLIRILSALLLLVLLVLLTSSPFLLSLPSSLSFNSPSLDNSFFFFSSFNSTISHTCLLFRFFFPPFVFYSFTLVPYSNSFSFSFALLPLFFFLSLLSASTRTNSFSSFSLLHHFDDLFFFSFQLRVRFFLFLSFW